MKIERVILYVFFISLGFWLLKKTACHGCGCGWGFNGIKGSGNVITLLRPVGEFSSVKSTAVIDLVLAQGTETAVRLEGDDNLLPEVKTVVEGGQLMISTEKNIRSSTVLRAFVTVKSLDELQVTGVTQVTCETPLALDRFRFQFTGVGGAKLRGSCNECELSNTGVGDIDALDFVCKKLEIKNSGTGNVKCRAEETISVKNTGVGNVEYTGEASVSGLQSTGVGSVKKI